MSVTAPAKVNLSLLVTGRRGDGYHLLDSLVVFAGVGDRIAVQEAPDLSLAICGPFSAGLAADDSNLVLRAARALAEAAGVTEGAAIELEKNLPVASGIGGGSSDAAATLRALQRLWNARLPADRLHALAAGLGADVPVCLDPRPRLMRGVGEILEPAPAIPACGILLANPGSALSTQSVFRARTAGFSAASVWPTAWPDAASMAASLALAGNDLQQAAIALCPPVGSVLARLAGLPGALLARMSGSGATCFALFATPSAAQEAAAGLHHTGWWCWGGPLYAAAAAT